MAICRSVRSNLKAAGKYLKGLEYDGYGWEPREMNKVEKAYLSTPSLSIITAVGALIAAIGVIALLAGTGNLPAGWTEALKISHISPSTLMIAGSVGVGVGGGLVLTHSAILGLKAYATPKARIYEKVP